MMHALLAVVLFVVPALAFTVTDPVNGTIWDMSPSHTVAWTSVSTDNQNFSIVLTNQHVNPPLSLLLKALVPTSDGSTSVNAPSSGWPNGVDFQINIVLDANNFNTILAQSGQFTIQASSSSSGSSSGFSSTTNSGSTTTSTPRSISSGSSNTQTTSPSSTSSTTSDGTGLYPRMGFVAAVALLGAVLS